MNTLPLDIIQDLVRTCPQETRLVCRDMRALSYQFITTLWLNNQITMVDMLLFLSRTPNIQHLNAMEGCLSFELLLMMGDAAVLDLLERTTVLVGTTRTNHLIWTQQFRSLVSLTLDIHVDNFQDMLHDICETNDIKRLCLHNVDESGVELDLEDCLTPLNHLEYLQLHGFTLDDPLPPSIQELHLMDCQVSNSGVLESIHQLKVYNTHLAKSITRAINTLTWKRWGPTLKSFSDTNLLGRPDYVFRYLTALEAFTAYRSPATFGPRYITVGVPRSPSLRYMDLIGIMIETVDTVALSRVPNLLLQSVMVQTPVEIPIGHIKRFADVINVVIKEK